MMRHLSLYIVLAFFLTSNMSNGQEKRIKKIPGKTFRNPEVEKAIHLTQTKNIEEALKTGLGILSSEVTLHVEDSIALYFSLANNLAQIGAAERALNYAKTAHYTQRRFKNTQNPSYSYLMGFYNNAKQYSACIDLMKKTLYFITAKKEKNVHYLLRTHNNIGFTYYLNAQLDSAKIHYKKVTLYPGVEENFSELFGLATGNLGQIYFDEGKYQKALDCMILDAELTKGKIWQSYNNALYGQANCHFILGQYNQCKNTLTLLLKQSRFVFKNRKRSLKLMAQVLKKLNRPAESAPYLEKYVALSDSLVKNEQPKQEIVSELSRSHILLIEKDLKLAKNNVDILKIKEKAQQLKNRNYALAILFTSFLVVGLVFFFINRQRKNREIHQLEKDLLSAELVNKKNDLTNFSTNLAYKRKFLDHFQEQLKALKSSSPENLSENLANLSREFNSYQSTDENVELLQSDIDKVNSAFFDKLGALFPLLTENEKELCGLFLLKISSKDIANIRNVSAGAIKKARYRIRKKLPIKEEEEILSFLQQI